MEKTQETIENKYKEFLELLKTNPEAIESQIVKNEYKDLLETVFEGAKTNSDWAIYILPKLLKLDMLEENDKERYKDLLYIAFENAKTN